MLKGWTMAELEAAAQKWPRWAEPHVERAGLETEEARKAQRWRYAAGLAMRDVSYWQKAASAFEKAGLFGEATKCLVAAEKAASTKVERERLHGARLAAANRRVDAEMAAQKAAEERERAEIERLRQEALNRIRMAEAKANDGKAPVTGKVEEWWEGPKGEASVSGRLERVDCVGGTLRLQVRGEDKRLTGLVVKDLSQLTLEGAREIQLTCGVQNPVRVVVVEYFGKTKEVTRVKFN